MMETFGSTCHGAGRASSRSKARRTLTYESVLEGLKVSDTENKQNQRQVLAKAMAKKLSVKRGRTLQPEEIDALIENLFACKVPDVSPDGKPTMVILNYDDLYRKFKIY